VTTRPVAQQDAGALLLTACGSPAWADAVAQGWPYADLPALLAAGRRAWEAQPPQQWLAALAAHPRIGDRPPAGSQELREQAAAEHADPAVLTEIAAGNAAYESRFGYTFVVRASGRTAAEMLAALSERLSHEPAQELRVAAAQQWEITALRLRRLHEEQG